ncbi:abortive phage infection protein [Lachnoclostridium sp. An169]|uniref:type IV toxin-antitoxin system AbiEi family antitoxin domain-containing protein n=1 Tax=Lachnoclostridium sp. An169 TaxID=1965569 RepID=UPI000B3AB203|nr:type IV toxin-antitoxin system AbiEi family antitoxin domain-containing protein [Lachnoclostridium sp. An169]OUP85667.1 abortive phage infection protein [Lachnoclostridium sp. An169]
MQKSELIEKILEENNGILRLEDALLAGISKTYTLDFIKKNNYEQVARGIYLSPDAWEDGMYILQKRYKGVVFSYETALYLLEMADREPLQYTVTTKWGYNPTNLTKQGVKVYTVKKEWYPLGITQAHTPMGHMVYIYNAERTICDIFRGNSRVEIQDRQTAIREYAAREKKNIPRLMEYAKIFKVEKIIKQYLEVLL